MLSRVYLTGFMTCGKSTIGPILANTLGWNFFDLDHEIEDEEKMTVVEIFESKGEDYFRTLETEILRRLSRSENIILALGGGTILRMENLELMKQNGKIIYLKSSPEKIYERIKNKLDRPLFKDLVVENKPKEEFIKRISDLLNERSKHYEKADFIYSTDSCNLGITVDQIAKKLEKLINEKN